MIEGVKGRIEGNVTRNRWQQEKQQEEETCQAWGLCMSLGEGKKSIRFSSILLFLIDSNWIWVKATSITSNYPVTERDLETQGNNSIFTSHSKWKAITVNLLFGSESKLRENTSQVKSASAGNQQTKKGSSPFYSNDITWTAWQEIL